METVRSTWPLNRGTGDGYLQPEDCTETINLSDLSEVGPINSTRISLQCSLPTKLNNHLSDTVIASRSHQSSFLSDLPKSMCHSLEVPSVCPRKSIWAANCSRELCYSNHTLNISDTLDTRCSPAREQDLVNSDQDRITLTTSGTSDELAPADCDNYKPIKISMGSISVSNGSAETHRKSTLCTAVGEMDSFSELSGICTLSELSRKSLSALVNDRVHKGVFQDSSPIPKLKKNQGLDVTSPDNVYIFSQEGSASCYDLENTLLDLRLSVSTVDDGGMHLDVQHQSLDNSKYDSCHSECYTSVGDISSYDGSPCEGFKERKGDMSDQKYQDTTLHSSSSNAGFKIDCKPDEWVGVESHMSQLQLKVGLTARDFDVSSGSSLASFKFEKEPNTCLGSHFVNPQEEQSEYTFKDAMRSYEPQAILSTFPLSNYSSRNIMVVDSSVPQSDKAKLSLTQDTAPADCIPSRDCECITEDSNVCAQLKAMMLSTKKKSTFLSRGPVLEGLVYNSVPFNVNCEHVDLSIAGSAPVTQTVSQGQETLLVEEVHCNNGAEQEQRSGMPSRQFQVRVPATRPEEVSQQMTETAETLTTDICVDQPATPGSSSHSSLSVELRRMMTASKSVQSPLPKQDERSRYITSRIKNNVTSSSCNSNSSLFDESLEMPQRVPRLGSPARGLNSLHAYSLMTADCARGEDQLCHSKGSPDRLQQYSAEVRGTESPDDTIIIEENNETSSFLYKTTGNQKTSDAFSHHSRPIVHHNSRGDAHCSSAEWDNASPTVLLRSQGMDEISHGKPDVPRGPEGIGGSNPDDSSKTVLLQAQGTDGPHDSIPTVLIEHRPSGNISDFFTDDKSSSFSDERKPFSVGIAHPGSDPLTTDTDNSMSDNTWMTEDGNHSDYKCTDASTCHSTFQRDHADLRSGFPSDLKSQMGTRKNRDVFHSTLLDLPNSGKEGRLHLGQRYSFSRLSNIQPSDRISRVGNNSNTLYPIQDLHSFDLTFSPGGRPVNTSMHEPVEYLYMDPEEGHALIERHYPCTDDSTQDSTSSNDTIIYDWKTYKSQLAEPNGKVNQSLKVNGKKILPELYRLSNDDIMAKLREFGETPGPVTSMTRRVYLALLDKLMKDPQTKGAQSEYSPELTLALQTYQFPNCTEDEQILSKQFDQPDKNAKWREGVIKSSFNYLLLDPRVTRNLPCRSLNLSQAECFRTFINAIFYVGKGKRSRPYSHLYEALTHYKDGKKQACQKVQHILDIWQTGLGVVSLHCFQNAIPVEAYTREACMVDAIGLKMLTNQKKGNYYGYVQDWPMKRRRKLGVHMLHRAMQIFLAEGERQLRPADIKVGQ
ncbi:ankyrin repeat and LEM domain-containing protein 1 isoform X2 [Ambystoma mexicanum]|uniref:ankyrin repeat and LEM domain-containing protein 1 isoform X2 n=1 Tax=Ambystoma mexicanum TaxID=8296 RepID=UPI0037E703D8